MEISNDKKEFKEYTVEQIIQNDGNNGRPLWIILKGEVYDVSSFNHPGGKNTLQDDLGEDRWDEFEAIHSSVAKKQKDQYLIGKLKKEIKKSENGNSNDNKQSSETDAKKKERKTESSIAPMIVLFVIVTCYILFFKLNLLGLFDFPKES